jgi:enediyne biosynthesis protein E5
MAAHAIPAIDPRPWQIAVLGTLLAYGVGVLGFDVSLARVAGTLAATLATQWLCDRFHGRRFDPKSPLISGLSLCLLLRTDVLAVAVAAGVVAIAGKFLIRRRGKHVFNPTCFAIVVALACTDHAWVSPGQWGSGALVAFALASGGLAVLVRSPRADVTWAFLAAYATLLLARGTWLGDPPAVTLHALQSGALLVFAFFMISDPRTVPDGRAGRIGFATLVATVALAIQFGLWRQNAPLWALAACAPLVPLIDRLLPAPAFAWPAVPGATKGVPRHAYPSPLPGPLPGPRVRPLAGGR